jgi:hypothetical protein
VALRDELGICRAHKPSTGEVSEPNGAKSWRKSVARRVPLGGTDGARVFDYWLRFTIFWRSQSRPGSYTSSDILDYLGDDQLSASELIGRLALGTGPPLRALRAGGRSTARSAVQRPLPRSGRAGSLQPSPLRRAGGAAGASPPAGWFGRRSAIPVLMLRNFLAEVVGPVSRARPRADPMTVPARGRAA